jgi:hypothetical protein
MRLADLAFRVNERFLYEYDFGDLWQVEVRIDRCVPIEAHRIYPVYIGGRRGGQSRRRTVVDKSKRAGI